MKVWLKMQLDGFPKEWNIFDIWRFTEDLFFPVTKLYNIWYYF